MKLDDWLSQRSLSAPDRVALLADGAEVTYAELEAEATWVARRLAAQGVRRGSIVALTMHPNREQVVLVHALMKVGAVLLPLGPRLAPAEHDAIIAAEEAAVDLLDPGQLTQTEADLPLLGEHDMDEIACRVLTSGSSGAPRPVGLTYGNFLWSAVGSAFNIGVDPADRWLCCLPLSHISALGIVIRSVIYGTTAVLHDGFETDRVAAALGSVSTKAIRWATTGDRDLTRTLRAGREQLLRRWPLPDHLEVRDALLAAYGDPARGYHDVRHLAEVLDRLDQLSGAGVAFDRVTVRLAAWFHDGVYDGRPDAEERSAAWAERALADTPYAAEVGRLVRTTETH